MYDTTLKTNMPEIASPAPMHMYHLDPMRVQTLTSDLSYYQPLPRVEPIAAAFKGKGPAKKRKADAIAGSDDDDDEEEDEDDDEDST